MSTCVGCSQEIANTATFCPRCGTPNPDAVTITPTENEDRGLLPSLEPGEFRQRLQTALGRDFTVGEVLGEGGFAVVFRVQDKKLSRRIAVKVLRPELAASKSTKQRFAREAESAASLSHPHILPIFFVGEGEGLVYFGMPLVEGETLDQRLARERQLPEAEVVRIGAEVADALAEAHAHGLVHRDVKPANVLLQGTRGRVLVADFGIAKAASTSGNKLTGTGSVIGSPHYMSPEQASGSAEVDYRSDIYSLGVVLWQMLAGELPFDAPDTQGILMQHLTQPLPPLARKRPGVSPALIRTLERCCAKKPEDRFGTVAEVAEALRTGRAPAPVWQQARRRRLVIAAGLGTAAVAAALFAVSKLGRLPPPPGVAAGDDSVRSAAPMLAVLPFDVTGGGDTAEARQAAYRIASTLADRFGVATVDFNQLFERWVDQRRTLRSLDSNVAFAYRMAANQLVMGRIYRSGQEVEVSADVYDTRTRDNIGRVSLTGNRDTLISLLGHLAGALAEAFCRQPQFNPRNLCFDVAARPRAAIAAVFAAAEGDLVPAEVRLDVLVDSAGSWADQKTPEGLSADLIGAVLPPVRAAAFEPARRRGVPVPAWTTVTVAVRPPAAPATTAAPAPGADCATPVASMDRRNGCWDTRPAARASLTLPPPPSCRAEVSPVQILVRVSEAGEVTEASVRRGSNCSDFDAAAQAQVQNMVFTPATKGGAPVAAWIIVLMQAAR